MRRVLFTTLALLALLVVPLGARATTGGQSILAQEANTGVGTVTALLSQTDATFSDTAVTDAALATAGGLDNSLPSLIDPPDMIVVDDDRVQCPNAQFTSINAAVLAAPAGATIRVCPGIYRESVVINKPLALQAPRHQGEATECSTPVPDDPTQEAIVEYNMTLNGGNPSEGFDVESAGVTIDGFKVEPDSALVTHDGVGIFTSRFFAGSTLKHNVVQNNTIGMYVNSDGSAPTTVQANCARLNNLPGAASGNGFYSDQGLSNAAIDNNYFTGDQNAAIVVDTFLTTPHDISITHNSSVNDGAIGTFDSANLTVDYNKVSGSAGSGIVTFNVTNSEYAHNDVENGMFNGISLHATTSSAVTNNKAVGFMLSGIRIADSSNNTISSNRAENNVQAGLAATGGSSGNSISQNHMDGNTLDCSDDTHGAGTAGTANFWTNDFGITENPPGICKHATP